MNLKANYKILILLFVILFMMTNMTELAAQCPMCRMAAESNLENGGTEGKGLNKGILYMLAMPYLLVSTVGFIWWRNNKEIEKNDNDDEIQ